MKLLNLTWLCLIILLLNNKAISQVNISNYFEDFIEGSTPPKSISSNCQMQSTAYITKYGDQTYNIPSTTNPEYKTLLVNFNIIQKDDGSGNFSTSSSDLANLNQIFNWFNDYYKYNDQPSDPKTGVLYLPDTYIRFELAGIYFYQNSTLWNSSTSAPLLNLLQSTYPERLNQINIFFTEGTSGNASGFTNQLPSNSNYNLDQCIVTFKKYNNGNTTGYYATAGHLAHEMGHVLGLLHTYQASCCPETCDESNFDYLDDLFGLDGINTNCWQDAGWSCDPYVSTNTCTNNMMGGTQLSGYFSPKQIGRMHRSLSIASTRRYVKNDIYYNYPLEITNNETWDFKIRLYNDVVVNSGSILTINCNVLMPNNSKFIVNSGGQLILDGGSITNTSLIANSGSNITILGDGYLKLSSTGNLDINNGAVLDQKNGTIYVTP